MNYKKLLDIRSYMIGPLVAYHGALAIGRAKSYLAERRKNVNERKNLRHA